VDATNALASGDLTYRVPVRRKDEFGLLQESFNAMTERLAQAQEQLVQSDKLASVGRLAAGVAHEINNPLTGVLSYSSFLLKRAPKNSEARQDLETIVRETKRCREIVKQLLDFSRQVPSKKTAVDLAEVIEHALNIVSHQLNLDNIRVSRQLDPTLPIITADKNQVLQVFINLLVNAADAIGGEGGEISLSARPLVSDGEVGQVEVKVADNGCGIPRDAVSRVFEPFYSTKEHEGTGLGLSVVWGIIDRHGGKIDIDSEVDRGTTVTLRFPVREGSTLTTESAAP
jgi:two-component system NtrC family sensor kinase